jgi:hypothetical protein
MGRACMGRSGMHVGFWCEIQKERYHQGDLDIGGIILKRILEKQVE